MTEVEKILTEAAKLVQAQQHAARQVQAGRLDEQRFSEVCRDLLQRFIQAIPDDAFSEIMRGDDQGDDEKLSPPAGYVERQRQAGMPSARKARRSSRAEAAATDENGVFDLDEAEAIERRDLHPGRRLPLRDDHLTGRRAANTLSRWLENASAGKA
jgi:hypothetical protein